MSKIKTVKAYQTTDGKVHEFLSHALSHQEGLDKPKTTTKVKGNEVHTDRN